MSLRGGLGRFFMGERFEAIAQALRLIVRIPLIQRREKCPPREEKKRLPIVVFLCLRT